MIKEIILDAVPDRDEEYDRLERFLQEFFKKEIYQPLINMMPTQNNLLKNSADNLVSAIVSGKIYYYRGHFRGKFDAKTSKELKSIGATWDKRTGSFAIPSSKLSERIKHAIQASENNFQRVFQRITNELFTFDVNGMISRLDMTKVFSSALWRIEKDFKKSIANITVSPDLTIDQMKKISVEYNNNMQLYVKNWTEEQIVELRSKIEKNVQDGKRYEGLVKEIQDSYGVSQNKAKFLARQETSLYMAKFTESRYGDAGITEYIWECVHASPKHPVRPMHLRLNGTRQSFLSPPIVNEKGDRKNPKEDYNCRCKARPIVKIRVA